MSHLTLETMARLLDEPPTPLESAHLEHCDACRAGIVAMREDAAALAALPREMAPPDGAWDALAASLLAQGVLRPPRRPGSPRWPAALLRIAAALLLFIGGAATGAFVFAGPDGEGARIADGRPPAGPSVSAPASDVPAPLPVESAPEPPAAAQQPAPPPAPPLIEDTRPPVRLAAGAEALQPRFVMPRTAGEAETLLRDAEAEYLQALGWWSEYASSAEGADPMARLAALEGIEQITRAALGRAPADPVINGFHLTALAQRDAVMRRLVASADPIWY
jgi:hypothetical protein